MSVRFYAPDPPHDGKLRLLADEARHLSRVCRFGVGDVVEVFDGHGTAARAQVIQIEHDAVDLMIVGAGLPERPTPFHLTLASAVPKGDRFDWLVEKATELGVERLIPLVTERSVVTPGRPKLERLRRAIVEASKQCGRNQLMVLETPQPWNRFVAAGAESGSIRLLADPDGVPPPRWPAITPARTIVLAIGPEGGFTAHERQTAGQLGWLAISLNVHTLRIETAGLAGCAALLTHARKQEHTA